MAERKKSYPYDADTLFRNIKDICARSRFNIKSVDEPIRRIILSTPPSLFSYGESVEVIVQHEGTDRALVYVKSDPKVFFNVTAGSAVERNISEIYQMLDDELE